MSETKSRCPRCQGFEALTAKGRLRSHKKQVLDGRLDPTWIKCPGSGLRVGEPK